MKKIISTLSLLVIAISIMAYEIPKFTNYVVDDGNLLTGQEENQLNEKLKAYQDSTSTQIAVLTLASFDDENEGTLFDFSMDVFKDWKLGQKSKKNGVLLIVVQNLASKHEPGLRIVTGYGIEGALPDAICKRIIESIRPSINEGQYYQGINTGITKMTDSLTGEFTQDTLTQDDWILIIIIIIVVIIIILLLIYWTKGDGEGFFYFFFFSSDSSGSSGGFFDGGGGGDSGGGGAGD